MLAALLPRCRSRAFGLGQIRVRSLQSRRPLRSEHRVSSPPPAEATSALPVTDRARVCRTTAHPRVVLVVNADWYFWSHRLPVARALRDTGFDVIVAAGPERGCGPQIEKEGLRYVPLPIIRGFTSVNNERRLAMALLRLYRREKPRIVHHVTIKPIVYGTLAARCTHVPAVVNAIPGQGYIGVSDTARALAARFCVHTAYRYLLRGRGRRVIFQNPDDRHVFVNSGLVSGEQTVVIRGAGVDVQQYRPECEPRGEPVILFPSRLLWSKGLGEFVDAVRSLRRSQIRFRAVVAGAPDPPNPDSVPESQLRRWHQQGLIEWIGHCDDMPALLAGCSVVVLPSYREGVPKVLLEAAAAGRPIVTTDAPGCREVVQHGRNGFLVPIRDSVQLAQALSTLLRDAPLRARFGAAGRELAVNSFAEQIVVEQTLDVYRELLQQDWPGTASVS